MLKEQRSTQICSGRPTLNYRTTTTPWSSSKGRQGTMSRGQSTKKTKMAREELQKKDNIVKKKEEKEEAQEMNFEETITFVLKN